MESKVSVSWQGYGEVQNMYLKPKSAIQPSSFSKPQFS